MYSVEIIGDKSLRATAGEGKLLSTVLEANGMPLNMRCGGRGLCRGCFVEIEDHGGVRACQWPVTSDLRLRIPPRSMPSHKSAVVADFKTALSCGSDPLFPNGIGVAVDIGTTTVALLLVQADTGEVLARASGLNAQVTDGDNVLTRIQCCQSDPSALARLQRAFWDQTFHPLLADALSKARLDSSDLAGVVLAGNTTMLHLACGTDPTPMGRVPFTPAFLNHRLLDGADYGLPTGCPVHYLPGLSAYVGADITAGAVCRGLCLAEDAHLLVDVGTNGEMLLTGPRGVSVCATAAGPAFEGCGLLYGMRAADGAIVHITMNENPFAISLEKLGPTDGAVHGITGSAYVDFLAEARRAGVLSETGRFDPEFVETHGSLFARNEDGLSLLLAEGAARIGEADVALLLQAKAAIAAGIETLLARQGLTPADIAKLHLAGGFGLHLNVANAIECGLIPGFETGVVEAVGNTSLGGAYLSIMDRSLISEMESLRAGADVIELNEDPDFEDRFVSNLMLP